MPRTVRDAALETRSARSRLRTRGEPYWKSLDAGLALGYRRARWGERHDRREPDEAARTVDEVAEMVLWLCSDACSFSTGAVFDISGGRGTY